MKAIFVIFCILFVFFSNIFSHERRKIGSVFTLAGMQIAGSERRGGGTFDLTGIPAPYNFRNNQGLATGESIVVGGGGDFQIRSLSRKAVNKKVADVDLNGVYFITSDEGWVIGEKGSIYRTTDRGESWTKQISNLREDLTGIDCLNRSECWVVGEKGIILKTTDGSHWSKVNSGIETDLFAVDFLNEKIGIAVGEKGTILRTNDGGRTWRQQQIAGGEKSCGYEFISENDNLADVTIINENDAWIAAEDGVAKYVGGTNSWEGICLKGIAGAVGVVSDNGQDLYVVGSFKVNFVSHDSGRTWKEYNDTGLQAFRVTDHTGLVILEVKRPLGDNRSESSFMLPKGTFTMEISMDGEHWARIAQNVVYDKAEKITVDFEPKRPK